THMLVIFFFSSRRRHTRFSRDWSSDVCSSDLFVEKVDFISGVGYPGGQAGRRELGIEWGGPELVFTPKCIFDFDKEAGRMRVKSIHPGVGIDDLRASTGFDLGPLGDVPLTRLPEPEELELLRNEVDPYGLLLPTT